MFVFDLSCLYSTVKNLSGQDKFFGFLPPHGRKLAATEEFTIFGNVLEAIVKHNRVTDRRQQQSFADAIDRGDLTIIHTPAPLLQDQTNLNTQMIVLDNGALAAADACWTASLSASEMVEALPGVGCFPACQGAQTSTPEAVVAPSGDFTCDGADGTYAFDAYTAPNGNTYHSWTWVLDFLAVNVTLEIRCNPTTGEIGANMSHGFTDSNFGGSDSEWVGFKDISLDVTCSGSNLAGTFVLDSILPACDGGGGGDHTATVTL